MRRRSLFVAVAVIAPLVAAAAPRKTRCETNVHLVGKCFRVHGRLLAYNGTPTFRIWPVGTHRLLGVNGMSGIADDADVPSLDFLRDFPPAGADLSQTFVYGDYLVCPFSRSRPGHMQYVCVAKASHLIARLRQP